MTFLPNVLVFWVNNVVFCDREAEDCALYLGEELKGECGVNVEAVGDGRVDGSTRALVTRQREGPRARVLSKALVEHHNQEARPTWVFPQLDKTACGWLLATLCPETFIPSTLFVEAITSHLCLPSPCCQRMVGKPTGSKDSRGNPTYIDVWGGYSHYLPTLFQHVAPQV